MNRCAATHQFIYTHSARRKAATFPSSQSLAEEGNGWGKILPRKHESTTCYTDRRYLYCGTTRSVSFSGSFLKFSLVTTMILSLPMNVVYASRFTSCGPNTRS